MKTHDHPLVEAALKARIEPVAKALAGLELDEPWPSNEALGGHRLLGTRDDEYRSEMRERAEAVLFGDPYDRDEPVILGVQVGEKWQSVRPDSKATQEPREVVSLSETHASLMGEKRVTRVRLERLGGKWRTISGYRKVKDAPALMGGPGDKGARR